ncbi:MAG: wza3 [Myxococcaceae bacterium]|nr:wza3 [Myxococcaceae bacterium]
MKTTRLWLLLPLVLTACRHDPGVFVGADEYVAPSSSDGEYVIRPGDVLNVRVFQQDNMSARARVRNDGKISLPFLNDVTAAGFTPVVLGAQLQTRLKDFINNPVVTVSLEEVRQLSISVLGEVPRPGIYPLDVGSGVLQALAAAGGFTNFAYRDVYVMRLMPFGEKPLRIRFDYQKLTRAEGKAAVFALRSGDTVLVE